MVNVSSLGIKEFDSAPHLNSLGYTTSGESDDWMLGRHGIISMSPEVGNEEDGFWPQSPGSVQRANENTFWQIIEVVMKSGRNRSRKHAVSISLLIGPQLSARLTYHKISSNESLVIQLINL